jgi:hypothetical protein
MSAKVTPLSQLIALVSGQVSGITNATNTRGSAVTGLDLFIDLVVLINITAGGTATGTLALFIQDSWDGGTTWDDLISSNTFALGGGAVTQRFVIGGRIDTNATQGSAVSVEALTAGTVRKGAWGSQLRLREKVSGVSGSPVGATYSVSVVAKR